MKKKFLFSLTVILGAHCVANAATPWWLQPTVCQLDPTRCYSAMGPGFDPEMWDTTGKCWGMKYICPDALLSPTTAPKLMGLADISSKTKINSDFDTDLMSADDACFGRRKTNRDGTMASVNGTFVNIWCPGILNRPDEFMSNGEITYGPQPTCTSLAEYGYVAIENGRCFGKYYDESKYYIDCGKKLLPERMIVLNGADYTTQTPIAPVTDDDADDLFDDMYSTSRAQKSKYFAD